MIEIILSALIGTLLAFFIRDLTEYLYYKGREIITSIIEMNRKVDF